MLLELRARVAEIVGPRTMLPARPRTQLPPSISSRSLR